MSNYENRPSTVSIADWIIIFILLSIPLVNFIMLIVWAFGNPQQASKKTFAQASLILWLVLFVLAFVLALLIPLFGAALQ